jgi:hemoglobin
MMLMDDRVSDFFDDVVMERQIGKQKAFLTMVFGGPNNYTGQSMRDSHRPLVARGLNDSHVDIVIGHLGDTLRELGVGEDKIAEVARLSNSVRDDVLNREHQAA